MARLPTDVVAIGDISLSPLEEAIEVANEAQEQFTFSRMLHSDAARFQSLAFNNIDGPSFVDRMTSIRTEMRGYHPFIIAVVDGHLSGKNLSNLFAYGKAKSGLGVTTTANVVGVIIPNRSMHAYYLFRLARHAMNFIAPDHVNHTDTGGCVYDARINKMDIKLSMKSGALCDCCREALLSGEPPISATQLNALNMLFAESGRLLDSPPRKPRVFIGSSSEGLSIAHKIQSLLQHDFAVEVWNQNTVFELGNATLEDLEAAVVNALPMTNWKAAAKLSRQQGITFSLSTAYLLVSSPGSEPSLSEVRKCLYQAI